MNFDRYYVWLNQFPEWYTVDENTLSRVRNPAGEIRRGSELIAGIEMAPGQWTVEPMGKAPSAR